MAAQLHQLLVLVLLIGHALPSPPDATYPFNTSGDDRSGAWCRCWRATPFAGAHAFFFFADVRRQDEVCPLTLGWNAGPLGLHGPAAATNDTNGIDPSGAWRACWGYGRGGMSVNAFIY